jgi:cell division protein FtsZ
MINVRIQSKDVTHLTPKITVIGAGGAGGNAVDNMIASNMQGVEFLTCNTDAQALERSIAGKKIQLGEKLTGGLGAGSRPEVGRAAAEESLQEIIEAVSGENMVFIAAGMGGGTGTGAAPVIARACRELGILTVGVVTKPFHFEGSKRMSMADEGIREMQEYVDTLIVIPNQNLFRVANEKTTFADAFKMADSVLQSGVQGVTDLMIRPGLINLDFADIRTAMQEMGKAMMGTGEASGDRRAIEAAEAAINNPLLDDVSMKGARGVIINITGGYDMTLFEADEACNRIRDEVDSNANIIFGTSFDEKLEGSMRVSVVATGIDHIDQRRTGGDDRTVTRSSSAHNSIQAPAAQGISALGSNNAAQGFMNSMRAPVANNTFTSERGSQEKISHHAASAPFLAPVSSAPVQPSLLSDVTEAPMKAQQPARLESISMAPVMQAANTHTMRGERVGGSFIPPRAIEVDQSNNRPTYGMVSQQNDLVGEIHSFDAVTEQAQPKSGSFFDRFGLGRDLRQDAVAASSAAVAQESFVAADIPSLNEIEKTEDLNIKKNADADFFDLDIPAFLRRQAN